MPSVGNVLGHIEEKAPTAFSRGVAQAPEHPAALDTALSIGKSFVPGNNTLEALKKTAAGNPEQAGPVQEYFNKAGITREVAQAAEWGAKKLGATGIAEVAGDIGTVARAATGVTAAGVAIVGKAALDPMTNQKTLDAADVENTLHSVPTSQQVANNPELRKLAEQHPELNKLAQTEDRLRTETMKTNQAVKQAAATSDEATLRNSATYHARDEAIGTRNHQLAELKPEVRAELRRLVDHEPYPTAPEHAPSAAPPPPPPPAEAAHPAPEAAPQATTSPAMPPAARGRRNNNYVKLKTAPQRCLADEMVREARHEGKPVNREEIAADPARLAQQQSKDQAANATARAMHPPRPPVSRCVL